jgi:hypothetical protein
MGFWEAFPAIFIYTLFVMFIGIFIGSRGNVQGE